ncbi:hypothetical protein DEA8626_00401 [Defluviimonas aquaemixtae]|uniref:Gfo/Idh/MocA-like oxidoreductase N-terminal domain-containing protein n=1 Tax=Albidovulum aquaemixtae TaxID=1542388 RepID=A0A2R8B2T0_9RHOB|nr:Gfo/Idh/MocA family oxidoreductase [Defluviimonas aquaemixtae]SPH16887.1 hypothetical protein DEA8626_00401 [Defluviimonas aquaemixtae]
MASTTEGGDLLLVGAGDMSVAYAAVLNSLRIRPAVFGRGKDSARRFFEKTGLSAGTGPLAEQIGVCGSLPSTAIVTVNAHALASVTTMLAEAGVNRILVEKPAALDMAELNALCTAVRAAGTEVYVAYNRRFMASVLLADRLIGEDGGPSSVKFDFTEASARIAKLSKSRREFETWFYGNSTHVLDLAFHFFGAPSSLEATVAGQAALDWHPSGAVYAGFGRNPAGAIICWHANWLSAGRWGVEVMTTKRKLILQPLEKLRVQLHGSFAETEMETDDEVDRAFKPGLLRQVRAFLYGEDRSRLQTLDDHANFARYYELIRTGGRLGA